MIVLPEGHRLDPGTGLCTGRYLEPWPCPPGPFPCGMVQLWLLRVYGPGGRVAVWGGELARELAGLFPDLSPGELYRRCLEWTRPPGG